MLNSKFLYDIDDSSDLTIVLNAVDSPKADDPGALTASEVSDDRRQAAPRNLLFDAGEELDQQTIGLTYNKEFGGEYQLLLLNYYVMPNFSNRLLISIAIESVLVSASVISLLVPGATAQHDHHR